MRRVVGSLFYILFDRAVANSVTACLMANNGKFISANKCAYTPNFYLENSNTDNHFFKNFIGKIRRRFGL
jgi:hypothetical protein